MSEVLYEVTLRVQPVIAGAYRAWLDAHVRELVALPGFVGSPANCWSHWFLFPPLPGDIEGYKLPDPRDLSLELLYGSLVA